MNNDAIHEKPKMSTRFFDFLTLSVFTIAVGIISLIVMDFLVFPLAYFAVHHADTFTIIITYCIIIVPVALGVYFLVRKVILLRSEGIPGQRIASIILARPLYYIGVFSIFMFFTCIIVLLLYVLFYYNYYLMYQFSI